MTYAVKILADSTTLFRGKWVRLTSIEATFPRFLLAEMNTHRDKSRNSASSRAIPVERRIEQAMVNPFVPEAFTINKSGMQADETADDYINRLCRQHWLNARDSAVCAAHGLVERKIHKQHANRLIELWAWHTVVFTATRWENFFNLRTHKAAQPEMQIIAKMMKEAYQSSTPRELREGEWHLPYVTDQDGHEDPLLNANGKVIGSGWRPYTIEEKIKVSVARAAALSYERQTAEKTLAQLTERHDSLLTSGHMSPFEHQAYVGSERDMEKYALWRCVPAHDTLRVPPSFEPVSIGNLDAPWIQHRKTIVGEDVFKGE